MPADAASSTRPVVASGPAPWFGRPWERAHAAIAGSGSLAACLLYWAATRVIAPDVTPGTAEFLGTATSLWSVWITQRRNVLALPIGIVSVTLMGAVFADIGLVGQALLHWAYYLPVQGWAWWQWTRGGEDGGELHVSSLSGRGRLRVAGSVLAGTVALSRLLDAGWATALHTTWDASIVSASVVAMVLLSRKKVESWWLWIGPVNVSAIGLYLATGAVMFAALYALFLVMAVVGVLRWTVAARADVP